MDLLSLKTMVTILQKRRSANLCQSREFEYWSAEKFSFGNWQ